MLRILVIKPSSLGDIIHSAGGVERLARARADCTVTWVANTEYLDFVREFPGVAEVIPFPRGSFRAGRRRRALPDLVRFVGQLRQGFDVAVDLQGLQRSALFARLSGARERFGFRESRELACLHYTHSVSVPGEVEHAVERLHRLVDGVLERSVRLAAAHGSGERPEFRLPVPSQARAEAGRWVGAEPGPLVALCPGARWPSKLWPVARWAELLEELRRVAPDARPVFLGAPGEEPMVDEILASSSAPAESLVGRVSLWATAALLERADVAFTMDSAPLHLAVAVGTPTVSLFGPTSPSRVGPPPGPHRVLRREELTCLGCYDRSCRLERRACLPDLRADEVVDAMWAVRRGAVSSAGGAS